MFKCPFTGCGAKFTTEQKRNAHSHTCKKFHEHMKNRPNNQQYIHIYKDKNEN